jgi:hypothetical protein
MEYGQLRDSTKAKKLIAKNLGTLCRQHFAFNREIELVIHHPFLERFYREIVLRHELRTTFDDGSHLYQILFDSFVMNLDFLPHDTILLCDPLFISSRQHKL